MCSSNSPSQAPRPILEASMRSNRTVPGSKAVDELEELTEELTDTTVVNRSLMEKVRATGEPGGR